MGSIPIQHRFKITYKDYTMEVACSEHKGAWYVCKADDYGFRRQVIEIHKSTYAESGQLGYHCSGSHSVNGPHLEGKTLQDVKDAALDNLARLYETHSEGVVKQKEICDKLISDLDHPDVSYEFEPCHFIASSRFKNPICSLRITYLKPTYGMEDGRRYERDNTWSWQITGTTKEFLERNYENYQERLKKQSLDVNLK